MALLPTVHVDSLVNPGEVEIIRRLLAESRQGEEEETPSVGVISLYAAQARTLARSLTDPNIQISTVDAFQGSEKDAIILSTVRSKAIGFSADPKRLNVAITRAKGQCVIVGNRVLLEANPLWHRILAYIRENGSVIEYCVCEKQASVIKEQGRLTPAALRLPPHRHPPRGNTSSPAAPPWAGCSASR